MASKLYQEFSTLMPGVTVGMAALNGRVVVSTFTRGAITGESTSILAPVTLRNLRGVTSLPVVGAKIIGELAARGAEIQPGKEDDVKNMMAKGST